MPTEATLTIEKLVYGGDGLARLDGRVVLVPYVAPGETVRATLERVKSDLFRGRLVEVAARAASRVDPLCPYFLRCGGCQYQHIDYASELEAKRDILREVLRRVGKIELDREVSTVAGEPWGYRNRIQLHVERGEVGYFEHGSRRLCAIASCPIASPALNQAIARLVEAREKLHAFSGAVELFTNETDVQIHVLDRAPRAVFAIFESLGTTGPIQYSGFRVSRNSFFQVNRFLVERLVSSATGAVEGDSAWDLYAGAGLFSRALAERFAKVTAVEAGQSAFRDLEHNVGGRAALEHSSVEDFLSHAESAPDFILADPPRAGLGKDAVRELARLRAPRLAIVSCDPATLARDLAHLLGAGYRMETIELVDLFPRTFHLETVVHLRATAV